MSKKPAKIAELLTEKELALLTHALEAARDEFSYDDIQKEYGITSKEYETLSMKLGVELPKS